MAVNFFLLSRMHICEKIQQVAALLKQENIPDCSKEAELIVAHVAHIDRLTMLRDNPLMNEFDAGRIDELVKRRLCREPLHYILGSVEFYGLQINVGKGVLVPRPETEQLVEYVLKEGREQVAAGITPVVLDLCTGSGCIALALAAHLKNSRIYAVDSSHEALRYAHENAKKNKISNVSFLRGDLFAAVAEQAFHIIVSNPPYIKTDDIDALQDEIRLWEPRDALDGGCDGLTYYREIVAHLEKHLLRTGKCFLEMGFDQKDSIASLADAVGLKSTFKKDLSGHSRIAVLSF